MDKPLFTLGLDVSKLTLDCCLLDSEGRQVFATTVSNNEKSCQSLFYRLKKKYGFEAGSLLVVMENTGLYSQGPAEAFHALSARVCLEHAMRIILSSGLTRGKSDKADAARIALYGHRFSDKLAAYRPPAPELKELRELLSERKRLLSACHALSVPLAEAKEAGEKMGQGVQKRFSTPAIKALKAAVKKVEQALKALLSSPAFEASYRLLCSVPGVGIVLCANLIAVTENFTRFTAMQRKQLESYCGLAPFEHSSGTSVKQRMRTSKKANTELKHILHMAAISALKSCQWAKDLFAQGKQKGKHSLSVLNRLRARLLTLCLAVIKHQLPYDPNYPNNQIKFAHAS